MDLDLTEPPEFGAVLKIRDAELADQFEDFLAERCFVLFKTRFDPAGVSFLFGQASSATRVRDLYDRFLRYLEAVPK